MHWEQIASLIPATPPPPYQPEQAEPAATIGGPRPDRRGMPAYHAAAADPTPELTPGRQPPTGTDAQNPQASAAGDASAGAVGDGAEGAAGRDVAVTRRELARALETVAELTAHASRAEDLIDRLREQRNAAWDRAAALGRGLEQVRMVLAKMVPAEDFDDEGDPDALKLAETVGETLDGLRLQLRQHSDDAAEIRAVTIATGAYLARDTEHSTVEHSTVEPVRQLASRLREVRQLLVDVQAERDALRITVGRKQSDLAHAADTHQATLVEMARWRKRAEHWQGVTAPGVVGAAAADRARALVREIRDELASVEGSVGQLESLLDVDRSGHSEAARKR